MLQSAFFRPNVLFLRAPEQPQTWQEILPIFEQSRHLNVGVMLLAYHPAAGLGRAEVVNLWIRPQLDNAPIPQRLQKGSLNLALLMAFRLFRAWKGSFNLVSAVSRPEDVPVATAYIEELRDLCRIPEAAQTLVLVGKLEQCITQAPQADMDFMGLQDLPDFEFVQRITHLTGSSCLFIRDSGSESALA